MLQSLHNSRPRAASLFLLAAFIFAAASLLFLPGLGFSGLSMSEGHRAIPGWEMLQRGQAFPTTLFDYPYVRKPPGMPWSVAAMSWLFGVSEFSARLVSVFATAFAATLCALAGARWFNIRAGLLGGAGYLLTPLFWYPARASEIEALHNFTTLAASVAAITLARSIARQDTIVNIILRSLGFGLAITGMMLSKGPAGIPVVVGAMIGSIVILRSHLGIVKTSNVVFAIVPALVTLMGVCAWALSQTIESLKGWPPPVTEPPSHFLWNMNNLPEIIALPIAALLSALPVSVSLFLLWRHSPLVDRLQNRTATALGAALAISLLIYVFAGVSNNRYAMPAVTLAPLVLAAAYTRANYGIIVNRNTTTRWSKAVRRLIVILCLCAISHHAWLEYRREYKTSGKVAGEQLAALIEPNTLVYAFEMIDHRPEVCWYLRRRGAQLGKNITCKWVPYPAVFRREGAPTLPPVDSYVLMRTDTRPRDQYPAEQGEYERAGLMQRLREVTRGSVHNFEYTLYRVLP